MIGVSVIWGLIFVYLFFISIAEFILFLLNFISFMPYSSVSHKVLCHLLPDKYYLVYHYTLLRFFSA